MRVGALGRVGPRRRRSPVGPHVDAPGCTLPEERSELQRKGDEAIQRVRKTRNSPGRRSQREPAQPPGLPKGWSDPPPIDLRALAFARSSHRPSCPKARRAMPVFGRRPGHPSSLPFDTVHQSPGVRSLSVSSAGEPTSVSELETRSAGYPAPLPPGVAAGCPAAVSPQRLLSANRHASLESRLGLSANRLRCLSTPFTLARKTVPSK